jgi:hypothetical protein
MAAVLHFSRHHLDARLELGIVLLNELCHSLLWSEERGFDSDQASSMCSCLSVFWQTHEQ